MGKLKDDIVKYRAKHNISMEEFASMCNLTLQTIYNIEREISNPTRLTESKIRIVIDADEEENKKEDN